MNAQINVLIDYNLIGDDFIDAVMEQGIDGANLTLVQDHFLASAVGQLVAVQEIPFRVVEGTETVALRVTEEQRLALSLALEENQIIRDEIITAEHFMPKAPYRL